MQKGRQISHFVCFFVFVLFLGSVRTLNALIHRNLPKFPPTFIGGEKLLSPAWLKALTRKLYSLQGIRPSMVTLNSDVSLVYTRSVELVSSYLYLLSPPWSAQGPGCQENVNELLENSLFVIFTGEPDGAIWRQVISGSK